MKTVNLELSKQLKANGYPQEGEFYWMKPYEGRIGYSGKGFVFGKLEKFGLIHLREYLASPTADEILEQIKSYDMNYQIYWNKKEWIFCFFKADICFRDAELANAIARMFLYLKENNLLSQKEKEG